MSFKTSQQLIEEAASDIGALGPGEALSAEDYAKFDTKLDSLLEMLSASESIYFDNKEQIPTAAFLVLARLLGNVAAAPVVGSPLNDVAWDRDVNALRNIMRTRSPQTIVCFDNF